MRDSAYYICNEDWTKDGQAHTKKIQINEETEMKSWLGTRNKHNNVYTLISFDLYYEPVCLFEILSTSSCILQL